MKKGVLFTGGSQPDFGIAREYIGNCDFVCGADSGIECAVSNGFVPDVFLGDMDSIGDKSILKKYPESKVILFPEEKDYTDTELGLLKLKNAGCDYSVLVGGGGGRADHFFYLFRSFSGNIHPDLWICEQNLIFFIMEKEVYSVFLPENCNPGIFNVSIFCVSETSKDNSPRCRSRNLKWPVGDLNWGKTSSLSNKPTETDFSISVEKGNFLLVLPLVKGIKVRFRRS